MNIAKANAIPLSEILARIGLQPSSRSGVNLWYLSPLRTERTPSFCVNTAKNVWYDHGEAMGGSVVGFVCVYLERQNRAHDASAALKWVREKAGDIQALPWRRAEQKMEKSILSIERVAPINSSYLIEYLESRGIPLNVAEKYLIEIDFHHAVARKTFKALGLRNISGGYEIRNASFKASVSKKNISFIRGTNTSGRAVHVFEGMFDYLSAAVHQPNGRFVGDSIILNSVANFKKAYPYIENHTYEVLYTWLDNDRAGEKARAAYSEFAERLGLMHKPKNDAYAPHKDVNAWHLTTLSKKETD